MKTQKTKDMERLWDALILCRLAHEGQTDKCGQPYWIHPFTVAMRSFTGYDFHIPYCIVGFLHDILEDTELTIEDIRRQVDLTETEVEALRLLTHQKGVPYDQYIDSIIESGNEVAMVVKLEDLMHNMNLDRMIDAGIEITDKDEKRVEKYDKASHKLFTKLRKEYETNEKM